MTKPFTRLAVVVLSLGSLLQLLRLVMAWELTINGFMVPVWASGIAFIIAGGLAVMVWRELRG